MSIAVRCAALASIAVVGAGCSDMRLSPTAPVLREQVSTPAPTSPVTTANESPRSFPLVDRPATLYGGVVSFSYPLDQTGLASRYVLYDDGTFALQFSTATQPFFEYRGRYSEADGLITFEWEGWSRAGPWGATALRNGDSLAVRYNDIMMLTDFENATYIRTP